MLIPITSQTSLYIFCRFTVHVDGVTGMARGSFTLKNGVHHTIHEQDLM